MGAAVTEPGDPGLVTSALTLTPPEETSVVTVEHSPLVLDPCEQVSALAGSTAERLPTKRLANNPRESVLNTGGLPTTAQSCR